MIARVEGTLVSKDRRGVVVMSGGIGFRIFMNQTALNKTPPLGAQIELWTNLNVREDRMELYGFLSQEELDFFEMLNSVAGIGPKSALSILDVGTVSKIKAAIASGDTALLTRVSGIGKKSAERIILELRSKVAGGEMSSEAIHADLDAEEALVSLGYSKAQAKEALEKVGAGVLKPDERVREALKILGRRSGG